MIAVNKTFEVVPWADYLFTICGKFLGGYEDKIKAHFQGEVVCHQISSYKPDFALVMKATRSGNSGASAIEFADKFKPHTIYLLGLDGTYDNGKRHHHEDYPDEPVNGRKFANAPNVGEFKNAFLMALKGVQCKVINCSPISVLRKHIGYQPLKDVLDG